MYTRKPSNPLWCKFKSNNIFINRLDYEKGIITFTTNIQEVDSSTDTSPLVEKIDFSACTTPSALIANRECNGGTFVPLIVDDPTRELKGGLYVSPSLTHPTIPFEFSGEFPGFDQFFISERLCIDNLRMDDQYGNTLPIIDFYLRFYKGQEITYLFINKLRLDPYKQLLFFQFDKLGLIINELATKDKKKQLFYHFRFCDYMLLGLGLYLRGKMSYKILEKFISYLYNEANQYYKELIIIAAAHDIDSEHIKMESPFDNLFDFTNSANHGDSEKDMAQRMLTALGYSVENDTRQKENKPQQELVKRCLLKLTNNDYQPVHQAAWKNYLEHVEEKNIKKLKQLYEIGHAVMLGIATTGKDHYQTCCLLPLAIKQIQQQNILGDLFPGIYTITYLDTLNAANDKVLYDSRRSEALAKVIMKRELLQHAFKNIFLFSQSKESEQPKKIDEVLAKPSRCV